MPLRRTPSSEQARYIQQESEPRTAARFVKAVERTFALLATNPRMGKVANFENPWLAGMRVFRVSTFENNLVYYRHLKGTLEIVRLIHGARDWEALFDDLSLARTMPLLSHSSSLRGGIDTLKK